MKKYSCCRIRRGVFWAVCILIVVAFVGLAVFNRTPARDVPTDPAAIVSPAHGDVIHIERVAGETIRFFKRDVENQLEVAGMEPPYQVVVIEMDLKNIHVQRMPIGGTILYQEYFPGRFQNALYSDDVPHLARENEKMLTLIDGEYGPIGVVQVAGIMARRIQSFVETDDVLEKGEAFGRITLGSQVVLVLPDDIELEIAMGDVLIDGETVVGRFGQK